MRRPPEAIDAHPPGTVRLPLKQFGKRLPPRASSALASGSEGQRRRRQATRRGPKARRRKRPRRSGRLSIVGRGCAPRTHSLPHGWMPAKAWATEPTRAATMRALEVSACPAIERPSSQNMTSGRPIDNYLFEANDGGAARCQPDDLLREVASGAAGSNSRAGFANTPRAVRAAEKQQ